MHEEDIEKQYPRYLELVKLYGKSDADEHQAETLQEELTELTISANTVEQKKKVPSSMTIANFKILCQRLFQVPIDQQLLFYKSTKDSPFPDALDDDSKTLAYYGVTSKGAVFLTLKK